MVLCHRPNQQKESNEEEEVKKDPSSLFFNKLESNLKSRVEAQTEEVRETEEQGGIDGVKKLNLNIG